MSPIAIKIAVVDQYLQDVSEYTKDSDLPHIIYAYARAWQEVVDEGVDAIDEWYVKFDEFDRQICDLYQISMDNIYFRYLDTKNSIEELTRQRESRATED